jgi:1-acyl-sn-glycerol-3-phosphate acyltransferase
MKAAAFAAVFVAYVLVSDFLIRLGRVFAPRAAFHAYLRRIHHWVLREVLHAARILTGLRVIVESSLHEPPPNPALVISNHQSMLDIPFVVWALPQHDVRFVAKEQLGRGVPLVAPSLRYGRHAIISRTSHFAETREALMRLARAPGASPAVFPEGTRSRDGSLGPFHVSAVRVLAGASDLPVLALAVDGGQLLRGLLQLHRVGGVRYRVRLLGVHPHPKGREETLRLLARIRADIAAQQAEWRR